MLINYLVLEGSIPIAIGTVHSGAALDATFGAIGFVPVYGWAVSGAYFLIAKPLYNYSTKP